MAKTVCSACTKCLSGTVPLEVEAEGDAAHEAQDPLENTSPPEVSKLREISVFRKRSTYVFAEVSIFEKKKVLYLLTQSIAKDLRVHPGHLPHCRALSVTVPCIAAVARCL